MAECPQETCFWSDGAGCSQGYLNPSDCPSLKAVPMEKQDNQLSSEAIVMPWSGGVLGLTDLGFIAGPGKPIVVAVIGPQNAGKTTLLGACYLLLGCGHQPNEDLRFAGSCSLAGWENVASPLRWKPGPVPPDFPPHTSNTAARIPGLLHLAFKRYHNQRMDYVITDAPGEWFSKWAINRDDSDAEGARWAADHADAFVLVADREALAGPEKGTARTGIHFLARRLADELQGRPVALVWTKSDIRISKELENNVRSAVLRVMPNILELSVSIMVNSNDTDNAQGFLDLLSWILNVRRPTVQLPKLVSHNSDPFFMFGVR